MATNSKASESKDILMSVGLLAIAIFILATLDERVPNPLSNSPRRRRGGGWRRRV